MENANVIYSYTLDQAIADGVLVEIFKDHWQELSGGKPIIATAHLFNAVNLVGLLDVWHEYVFWRKYIMATLPEEEQMFVTTLYGDKIWLIEDGAAFTMMYPEDY